MVNPIYSNRRHCQLPIENEAEGTTVSKVESAHGAQDKTSITIVIPCFNEEPVLPFLRDTLHSARKLLGKTYDLQIIVVDDGSTDRTWPVLQELFQSNPEYRLLRHGSNLGIAAAILTGLRAAETEIVCSVDSDCTYDPHQLEKLVPMLTSGVDLVTGSPYHPLGEVEDVPRWRLALSKAASAMDRFVLHHKLYTYTSCFRVYRRSAILNLNLRQNGFLGIAELIGKLDLQGSVILECPTRLEGRVLGVSKMKVVRVIAGHLNLAAQFLAMRGRQRFLPAPVSTTSEIS
jgi:glycosyltransferase involved in cell wall biosynthesis